MTISFGTIDPQDASALHRASREAADALARTRAVSGRDRERVAAALLWVARSGYGCNADGVLDEDALSQAAVARFRSVEQDD